MNQSPSSNISQILIRAQQGDQAAREKLAQWLMDEAQAKVLSVLKKEQPSTTESSLISNVLLKLVRGNTIERANNVGYLRRAIMLAARDVVVDLWRQRKRRQANGERVVSANPDLFRGFDEFVSDIDDLHRALEELQEIDQRKAMVVICRFFLGMTVEQTARELGISESSVEADWRLARIWLFKRLKKDA